MSEPLIDLQPAAAGTIDEWSISGEETLRRRLVRLAYDVHDGPMQSLTAVGYGLNDLSRQLGEQPEAISEQLATMIAELAQAEGSLRKLISSLEQGIAEIDSLDEIVAGELARFARRSDAVVETIVEPPSFQPDSHSQAIAIRSVLREALTNIAKHSGASRVDVRLQASQTGVLLEITDDGRGFDPEAVGSGTIGLGSMRERIDLLDGSFDVRSRVGGPTAVTAHLRRWRRPQQGATVAALHRVPT